MNVTTVMLSDEQRDTLMAAATNTWKQARACATSRRLLPALRAEYRNRAAALGNAIAALDVNTQPGNLVTELREFQEQHARLQRQLDEEKARGDTLAAALCNTPERLGAAAGPAEVAAARALVSNLTRSARLARTSLCAPVQFPSRRDRQSKEQLPCGQ